MEGLQEVTNALSNGTNPDPLRPRLLQDWGFATPPKTPMVIISGTGKATDFKFGRYIQRVDPNKRPLKILEKRERGRIQGLLKFFGYPLLSQERVKLRTSNFVRIFTKDQSEQKPIRNREKQQSMHGRIVIRDSRKFSGHHRAVIFAIAQFSCIIMHLNWRSVS